RLMLVQYEAATSVDYECWQSIHPHMENQITSQHALHGIPEKQVWHSHPHLHVCLEDWRR
ncbi:Hypothetical predicted protein, partial [Podarcis lilfordi]